MSALADDDTYTDYDGRVASIVGRDFDPPYDTLYQATYTYLANSPLVRLVTYGDGT